MLSILAEIGALLLLYTPALQIDRIERHGDSIEVRMDRSAGMTVELWSGRLGDLEGEGYASLEEWRRAVQVAHPDAELIGSDTGVNSATIALNDLRSPKYSVVAIIKGGQAQCYVLDVVDATRVVLRGDTYSPFDGSIFYGLILLVIFLFQFVIGLWLIFAIARVVARRLERQKPSQ